MRRQLKPVKRGVERSEYVRGGESKAARGGGRRGEETKRRAPRIRSGRGKGVSDKAWSRKGMHVVQSGMQI